MTDMKKVRNYSILGVVLLISLVLLWMFGIPQYRVWEQGLSGKAKLKEAEYSRQILVQEANATKESAKMLAEAEVERAKGVAQANEIIGKSLKENE